MNWKHVSLGEISVNIQTGPFGSQLHQSDYSEKGTPVVSSKRFGKPWPITLRM